MTNPSDVNGTADRHASIEAELLALRAENARLRDLLGLDVRLSWGFADRLPGCQRSEVPGGHDCMISPLVWESFRLG